MRTLAQDLRYALRQLFRSPGFTITAVLSLTFGIAATTAVFSVVWGVIMNPYPYAAPERMVHVNLHGEKPDDDNGFGMTTGQWQQFRNAPGVEDSILTDQWNLTVTGQDLPEDVQATYMTSNSFNFFGVPAALGRGLLPSDAVDGQDPQPVVVLSHKFWMRRYNGDPSMVGKTIQLVRKPYTVVGVAAPRFTWNDADIYLPLKISQDPVRGYNVEARLKPGFTARMAEQQWQAMIEQFAKETPKHFPSRLGLLHVMGLNERFLHEIGGTLALLFGAVALLLTIGCGNVSILLLARGTARQHEFAVRGAIGASRGRIVRQLLTESVLLSMTGAVLGTLVAYKLLALIVILLPGGSFPHEAAIGINTPVLVFSVFVALATGVLFGLSPALRLSRPDVREAMQAGTRRVSGSASTKAVSNGLIAGQIALTLLMMAAAGAAIQGFLKLVQTPLGYDPHHVMSVGIPIHENTYTTIAARSVYFEALRNKVAETQGVTEAAISSNATPPSNGFNTYVEVLGKPSTSQETLRMNLVSEGYFPVLGIKMNQGRIWSEAENHNAAKLTVVNQTFAKKYFPGNDAIGHSLRLPELKPQPPFLVTADGADGWLQIVGVIADKLDDGLRKPVLPEVFIPFTLATGMSTQVLVRTSGNPTALLHEIGLQVKSLDPDQQIYGQSHDLEHWISEQTEYQQGQLVSWLFGSFAFLALLLAAVGLYSVVSYTVAQRTNEFGIRMALGAMPRDVLRIVFRSTSVSVGGGIAAGILLTLALRQVLVRWAEGSAKDPWALVLSIAVLIAVALIASGVPARRATRIEPMEALRYE